MNGSWKQQTQKGKPTKPEIIRKTLSITVGLIIKYHACIIKNLAQVRCCSPPSLLLSHHRLARTSGPLVLIEGAEWYLSMVHQLNTSIAHFALITSSYIQTAFGQLQRRSGELSASSLMHWTGSFLFDSRGNLRRCIVSHQHHHHLVVHYQTAWFASCVSTLLFISGRLLNCSSRCPTGSTGSPSGAWRWLWLCWIKWADLEPLLGSSHRECRRPKGNLHVKWGRFHPQTGGAGSTTEPSGNDPPVPSHDVHWSRSVKHQKVWKWCKLRHLWSVCVCVFAEVWSSHSRLLFSYSSAEVRFMMSRLSLSLFQPELRFHLCRRSRIYILLVILWFIIQLWHVTYFFLPIYLH